MESKLREAELLIQQGRYDLAKSKLSELLAQEPEHYLGRYYYAVVELSQGNNESATQIMAGMIAENPEDIVLIDLMARIDLAEERYEAAESRVAYVQSMDPENAEAHLLMARVKAGRRSYDTALINVEKALELDPENIDALNVKISLNGLLGKSDNRDDLETALNLDPESVYTIANQSIQMIREGKVEEALERLKYALSIEPTNEYAQYAMIEALKHKFWPYRLFFKYQEFSARLSKNGSWGFIIGAYLIYRVLYKMSDSMPFLKPIVYLLIVLFILTWVMVPLTNLYLLLNPYGRFLLDSDEKKMAKLVGGSLTLGLISFLSYYFIGGDWYLNAGVFFIAMMIPLGSFLTPKKEKSRKTTIAMVIGVGLAGLAGLVLGQQSLLLLSFLGIFIYQWVINGILIKENARVYD